MKGDWPGLWYEKYRFYWWLQDAKDWLLQIWYCHHNARVLADMEWRLSVVLDEATDHLSKPYYDIPTMISAISLKQERIYNEGYEDAKEDYSISDFDPNEDLNDAT